MVFKLQSRHYFVTETTIYKVRRGITQKYLSKSYGSCALHIIYFYDVPWGYLERVFKLQSGYDFVTDRQTDGQMTIKKQYVSRPWSGET